MAAVRQPSERLRGAPSKAAFMKWGWIDLLATVPAIPVRRWGRVFRRLRIARLLLALKSFRRLLDLLFTGKSHAGFAAVFAFGFVSNSCSSIAILLGEGTRGNIHAAGEAHGWCLVTLTTIGYGAFYPVTTADRPVAVVTMFSGVVIWILAYPIAARAARYCGSNSAREETFSPRPRMMPSFSP